MPGLLSLLGLLAAPVTALFLSSGADAGLPPSSRRWGGPCESSWGCTNKALPVADMQPLQAKLLAKTGGTIGKYAKAAAVADDASSFVYVCNYVQGVEGNVLATELSLTRDMLDANCGVGQSGWVWLCTRNKTYGFEKSGEDYCGNM